MSRKYYGGLRVVDPSLTIMDVCAELQRRAAPAFREKAWTIIAQSMVAFVDGRRPGQLLPDAYRIPDLREPTRTLRGHVRRKRLVEAVERMAAELGVPVSEVDVAEAGPVQPEDSLVGILSEDWLAQQDRLGQHSAFNDPLRLTVVFAEAVDGRLLAYKYDANGEYDDALGTRFLSQGKRLPLVPGALFEDHHFQDSADADEDVPHDEWIARREDWDRAHDGGDGSMAHLPHWSLPRTIESVWDLAWTTPSGEVPDLASLVDEGRRLSSLASQRFSEAKGLFVPDMPFSEIARIDRRSRKAVAEVLGSSPGLLGAPPALPALEAKVSELPEPYELSEKALEALGTAYDRIVREEEQK